MRLKKEIIAAKGKTNSGCHLLLQVSTNSLGFRK